MESGYHLYDFKGLLLREEHIDRFKQFAWRPRPPTLLSKDEQKTVRRNLRDYSKRFEEQDALKKSSASKAVIEQRMRLIEEWRAWREQVVAELQEDRRDAGLAADAEAEKAEIEANEEDKVVEEIQEEIIEEKEEVM
jgi:translation initiation factor 3 subunit B